jgi:hypothetical protein
VNHHRAGNLPARWLSVILRATSSTALFRRNFPSLEVEGIAAKQCCSVQDGESVRSITVTSLETTFGR